MVYLPWFTIRMVKSRNMWLLPWSKTWFKCSK